MKGEAGALNFIGSVKPFTGRDISHTIVQRGANLKSASTERIRGGEGHSHFGLSGECKLGQLFECVFTALTVLGEGGRHHRICER